MNTLMRLVIIGTCISLTGCAINRESGTFDPGEDIVAADIFYVERFTPDNRELHKLIADNISVRGCRKDTLPRDSHCRCELSANLPCAPGGRWNHAVVRIR